MPVKHTVCENPQLRSVSNDREVVKVCRHSEKATGVSSFTVQREAGVAWPWPGDESGTLLCGTLLILVYTSISVKLWNYPVQMVKLPHCVKTDIDDRFCKWIWHWCRNLQAPGVLRVWGASSITDANSRNNTLTSWHIKLTLTEAQT
jgi:hypothetical protein